ncbi:MAG TPA: hypothetical protein VG028_02300 [Terriglobia bacterium]|nr:hypothetical protein [Terriglobia bacterium]
MNISAGGAYVPHYGMYAALDGRKITGCPGNDIFTDSTIFTT